MIMQKIYQVSITDIVLRTEDYGAAMPPELKGLARNTS